jgi:sporulation protein YlmC with PRC-barrel domain
MKATATRQTLSASSLIGDTVRNGAGEKLGEAKELMIDLPTGRIAYAVLSFGGFLGVGDKLFAVPWSALALDEENRQLVLDVSKEVLEAAPGFDKNNWPDMADPVWGRSIYEYYNQTYWE